MPFLSLGPWEPDSAGVESRNERGQIMLQDARGVYPSRVGYAPMPDLVTTQTGTALTSTCKGMAIARKAAGGFDIYAGTTTKLYKFNSGTSTWDDVSRVAGGNYAVPTSEFWSFAQFGPTLIAVNSADAPQSIDVDSGTNFAALAGSPPQARYVGIVGDFVVLACLNSDQRKIRNSGFNSATSWTVGTNLCDEKFFPDGGVVSGFAGGEFGWITQETAIRRMILMPGSDQPFRYERLEREHGAISGYSLISTANGIFFLANDGFYQFSTSGLMPIGAQRVNQWFRENSDAARVNQVIAFASPYHPRVLWAFYNSGNSAYFDRLLCYDWQQDRWTYAIVTAQFWCQGATAGATLEGVAAIYGNLDTMPVSLDSTIFLGGRPTISAIDSTGKLAFLESSAPQDARLLTTPMRLLPSGRANVSGVEPVGVWNDAMLTVRVGKRERTQDSVSYTTAITPSTRTNIARFKSNGRFHEVELNISQSSGDAWTQAQGLDVLTQGKGTR